MFKVRGSDELTNLEVKKKKRLLGLAPALNGVKNFSIILIGYSRALFRINFLKSQ